MIGLDSYTGFALLLLLPLLLWSRKRRSAARTVLLTVFPIVADLEPERPTRHRERLRLPAAWRYALFTLALLSLALAVNGIHLVRQEERPGQWLLVVDNTYALNASVDGRPLKELLAAALTRFAGTLPEEDTITLLTTAPAPSLKIDVSPADLAAVAGATAYPTPDSLVHSLSELVRGRDLKGAWLLSPRAHLLRPLLPDADPAVAAMLPREARTLSGNRGITAVDLSLSPSRGYDVFLSLESVNMPAGAMTVRLTDGTGVVRDFTVPVTEGGAGSLSLPSLALPPGNATLELLGGDLLANDDGAALNVPGPDIPLVVSVSGEEEPWLTDAVDAYDGFTAARSGQAADAAIFLRDMSSADREVPSLYIFPTGGLPGFEFRRIITAPAGASFSPGHPVTADAVFRNFRPVKLVEIALPGEPMTVASAEGFPLVSVGLDEGRRFVVWHFDPADSGIYLDPAFPILLRESVRWLAGFDLRTGGLLDRTLTTDAGTVTVPETGDLATGTETDVIRTDIARPFILLAFLVFLVLLADRGLSREAQE